MFYFFSFWCVVRQHNFGWRKFLSHNSEHAAELVASSVAPGPFRVQRPVRDERKCAEAQTRGRGGGGSLPPVHQARGAGKGSAAMQAEKVSHHQHTGKKLCRKNLSPSLASFRTNVNARETNLTSNLSCLSPLRAASRCITRAAVSPSTSAGESVEPSP